jgi:hypothetical protein
MQELIEVIKLMNPAMRGVASAATAAVGIVCLGATTYEKVKLTQKENDIAKRQSELDKQQMLLQMEKQEFDYKRQIASKDDAIKHLESRLRKWW